jgi:polyphenol oxidase
MLITSPLFSKIPRLKHGFFTREGGVSQGVYASLNAGIGSNDVQDNVQENRARMANAMGVEPSHLLSLYQIHSNIALDVDRPFETRPQADGLVTKTPKLAISAASADCGPLLFVDPQARIIGACHAGWKGALNGILESTLEKMVALGASKPNIQAALGPMIQQKSYEVGEEFKDKFLEHSDDYAHFFENNSKAIPHFNLPAFIEHRLTQAGLTQIDNCGLDTYSDTRFYSYRRMTHKKEADYGRHLAVIALEE